MPDQELISSYIDLAAVGSETDAFLAQIKRLDEAYASVNSKSISLGGVGGAKETTAAIKALQADFAALQQTKQKLLDFDLKAQKVATEAAKTKEAEAKAAQASTKAAQEEAKAKADLAKQTQASANAKIADDKKSEAIARKYNADQAKAEAKNEAELQKIQKAEKKIVEELSNDYLQLSKAYNEAALKAKNLAIVKPGSNAAAAAAADAKAIGQQLKDLDASVGVFGRNVGNYGNVFGKAFGAIRTAANILPGIGISGIFLLIFEGISKAAEALGLFSTEASKTEAEAAKLAAGAAKLKDSFIDLDEAGRDAAAGESGNIAVVKDLAAAVLNTNLSYDQRKRALEELKEINKSYFGDLTLETATYGKLTALVNEYAQALIQQAVIKEFTSDIAKTAKAISDANEISEKQRTKLAQATNDQAKAEERLLKVRATNTATNAQGENTKVVDALNARNAAIKKVADAQKQLDNVLKDSDALQFQRADAERRLNQAILESLKLKDLQSKPGASGSNTELKTFDAKANNDEIKRFIQLEKDASTTLEAELSNRLNIRKDAYSRELELLLESTAQEKKVAEDAANDVLNDPKASTNARINARNKLRAELETIDNNFNAKDAELLRQFERDYDNIIATSKVKRLADEKATNEAFLSAAKAAFQARLDLEDKNNEKLLNARKEARDLSITSINEEENEVRRKQGFITEKQETEFNQRRLVVEQQFLRLSLDQVIAYYRRVIEIRKANGEDVSKLEAALQEARRRASENEIKEDEDEEKRQQKLYQNRIKALQGLISYARQFSDILRGAFDASIDTQKNILQDQADQIDVNKQKEIDAVNATTLAASEKADKIAIINAKAQTQKEEIDRKQRQLDQQKARFDKALTIANIIEETALAVVRALGAKPYTPANLALAALTGALGAAQLAVAIATPIPKYKMGTQNHPGGPAEVGHGKPEYVLMPSGKGFVTGSTPVQMDLPRGTKVYPDANNLPADILRMALQPMRRAPQGGVNANDDVVKELKQLAAVVRNKPILQNRVTRTGATAFWMQGDSWVNYVNENTRY